MKLETADVLELLRDGTKSFVSANGRSIASALSPMKASLDKQARALSGAAGLVLKKRTLEAHELWERFFWCRVASHHLKQGLSLDEALRLADEDLLALATLLGPL